MTNSTIRQSKVIELSKEGNGKDPLDVNVVTINEKVCLTENQYEVLKTICHTYEESISDYMKEALTEAMKFDIEEGNFCDTLLEKIDNDDKNKNNSPPSSSPSSLAPDLMNTDLDLLKKLQAKTL